MVTRLKFSKLGASLLLACLAGCAFNDIPLTLPDRGLEETIRGGEGRRIAVELPFADGRSIKRCGMQKNGYNMDTADAVCKSDPAEWIAHLLASELRAAGFQVVESAEASASIVEIGGELGKLFVEPVIGFWSGSLEADLNVRLVATSESGLEAERTFFVKGWKGGVMLSTLQPYHTALDRATQKILREMVTAIIELMNRYPELGLRLRPLHPAVALATGARS